MKTELTLQKAARFTELKRKIKANLNTAFEIGFALKEIHDDKLYCEDFDSFDEFCQSEYGIHRSRAYRLIEAAEVKASPIGDSIQNEGQARAIAKIPPKDRKKVLAHAEKSGGVTAPAIEKAAEELKKKKDKIIELDKTGCAIPESVLEDWHRAESVASDLLSKISDVKCAIELGINEGDVIFRELHNTDIATIKSFFTTVKAVRPYAICPACAGHQKAKCIQCKNRGFLSEFYWKNCIPSEMREIREKSSKR